MRLILIDHTIFVVGMHVYICNVFCDFLCSAAAQTGGAETQAGEREAQVPGV